MTTTVTRRKGFAADRRGTTSVFFALSLVPVIGLLGLGYDYTMALARKARLDAAADAAALTAINAARDYITLHSATEPDPQLTIDAKAAGQSQGVKSFDLNAAAELLAVPVTPNVAVNRSGPTITATVSYAGQTATTFGGIVGINAISVADNAGASLTMGSYLDFYLALDVSGSMGLPTAASDQTKLQGLNGGCQFACHFSGQSQGYTAARANGIKLRVDSVGTAVAHLVQTAINTSTFQNQYRVGAYPFVDQVMEAAPLSTNLAPAALVGTTLGDVYLDAGLSTPVSQQMGSGGTHFENLLPEMKNYVNTIGDGTSALKPKPFLFIVTDGMDNNQTWSPWTGSQPREPNNLGYCQLAQQLGVTIAILYIPYAPITNPPPANAGEATAVNNAISNIPGDLSACANKGFFFTANTDADIDQALQAMFNQALKAARLTT